jgi:hypothetical protein
MCPREHLTVTCSLDHGGAVTVPSLERGRGLLRRAHPEPLGAVAADIMAGVLSLSVQREEFPYRRTRCRESVDGEGGRYGGC